MVISSQTPEGQTDRCQVCGARKRIQPSEPAGDAPCPRCGHCSGSPGKTRVMSKSSSRPKTCSTRNLWTRFWTRSRSGRERISMLDLAEVQFFPSAVLSRLIDLKKTCRCSVGGRFTIRNVHPDVLEALRITRLDHVFDLES